MANKATSKKAAKTSTANDENVVRIKAGSSSTKNTKPKARSSEATTDIVVEAVATPAKSKKAKKAKRAKRRGGVLRSIGGYFKGAWVELRQVRWPNRRATWSMTGAVLAYSAFFIILVLLLDAGFKYLFQLILGK